MKDFGTELHENMVQTAAIDLERGDLSRERYLANLRHYAPVPEADYPPDESTSIFETD